MHSFADEHLMMAVMSNAAVNAAGLCLCGMLTQCFRWTPGRVCLSHMVALFLVLQGTDILISIVISQLTSPLAFFFLYVSDKASLRCSGWTLYGDLPVSAS